MQPQAPPHPSDAFGQPRALLIAVQLPDAVESDVLASLDELENLVSGLGYRVTRRIIQKRAATSSSVLGSGKLDELSRAIKPSKEDEEVEDSAPEVDVAVVDQELSGGQARQLEKALGVAVLDRTNVILRVFEERARTREARLQVELARLNYEAPRLRDEAVSDARGGGGRGERGHTNVELGKQRLRERIAALTRELEAVERGRKRERARRRQTQRVALVGYTNAGKSSLMRALTSSAVLVEDKLFATLDTTVRSLQPERVPRILVSDTVGFMRALPHTLLASFRSTLDEANEADLLLNVVDASDPDIEDKLGVTRGVLTEIGAGSIPCRLVLNKIDRVAPDRRAELEDRFPGAVTTSAYDPASVAQLRDAIEAFFDARMSSAEFELPYAMGKALAELRANARVTSEHYTDTGITVTVQAPPDVLARLRRSYDAFERSSVPG
jgi:GTP-binding protein HflX